MADPKMDGVFLRKGLGPIKKLGLLPIEWVISVDFPSARMLAAKARGDSGRAPGAHPAPGGT